MAEGGSEKPTKYPAVPQYGPYTIRDLKPGEKKKWCSCGLSKKQPWCDDSHKCTGFTPLLWTVPEKQQKLYQICACKYTRKPPYCDGTHVNLPCDVLERQKGCAQQKEHSNCQKLCTSCGFIPDF
ncbi:CDGSH iron-sulfur domain-containing protein 3, mitochondrial-like isoform X2 [Anneissia japonica]|uniref:CDGSH iron-sulfur domain-containing protein 3, mitochondrial-like isoform X2 n=1 Tax=Anneissia japonica TaxID=1529436 RepID=UPI001425B3E5|nr:CDGSH iron-sulfur domain-containing protein 3, mitochondrial-like isoform X2 [Anneissia japonica]